MLIAAITMEVANYLPGDQRLVDKIVNELKSQGIFDQFRKECFADVDTKPAYQNLRQRVEGNVSSFLRDQSWRPDMNKNQVREMLRKKISESGYLETGVERIVDQVVNPKINPIFLPKVEEIVYKYLGIQKPSKDDKDKADLLPTDLEAVSPESVDKKEDESIEKEEDLDDSKVDEDESPPFEPLDEQTTYLPHEENSIDSQISAISTHSTENKIASQIEHDSQTSRNSSDSRLSIVTSDENSKIEPGDDSQTKTIANKQVEAVKSEDKSKSSAEKSRTTSKDSKDRERDKRSSKDSRSRHSSSSKDKERKSSSSSRDNRSRDKSSKSSSSTKYSSSSSRDRTKSESSKDRGRSSTTSSSSHRDSSKSKSSYRHSSSSHDRYRKESSSSHKDKRKDSKSKDDHYSSKDNKKNDRRSTDRDSNDGHASKSTNSNNDSARNLQKTNIQQESKTNSGESTSGGQSDNVDKSDNAPENAVGMSTSSPVRIAKPKFASNMKEAMKLMKIRKQLAKLEKKNQLGFASVNVETDVLNSSSISLDTIQVNGIKPLNNSTISQASWDRMEAKLREEVGEFPDIVYSSDDEEEDVRYFAGGDEKSSTFVNFINKHFEKYDEMPRKELQTINKRKCDDTDARNNNTKTMGDKKRKIMKKINIDGASSEKFPLPLSPAESDTSKEDVGTITKPKRSSINKANSQRYSSDDLYKPRPTFATSRRRGAKPTDN